MKKSLCNPRSLFVPAAVCAAAFLHSSVQAQLVYVSQSREIIASTTADATTLTAIAPDFAPFDRTLENSAIYIAPTGPRINRARTTITSILDSNSLQMRGECLGEGGENESGMNELGESYVNIDVFFRVAVNTPFHLSSMPFPQIGPDLQDEFKITIDNETTGNELFTVDNLLPPAAIEVFGTFVAGQLYRFRFSADLVSSSVEETVAYNVRLQLPPFDCDSIDFNNDGSLFDPQDIDALLSRYSEGPCIPFTAVCNDIDFDNNQSIFDPMDIDAFLRVYSEGSCL